MCFVIVCLGFPCLTRQDFAPSSCAEFGFESGGDIHRATWHHNLRHAGDRIGVCGCVVDSLDRRGRSTGVGGCLHDSGDSDRGRFGDHRSTGPLSATGPSGRVCYFPGHIGVDQFLTTQCGYHVGIDPPILLSSDGGSLDSLALVNLGGDPGPGLPSSCRRPKAVFAMDRDDCGLGRLHCGLMGPGPGDSPAS